MIESTKTKAHHYKINVRITPAMAREMLGFNFKNNRAIDRAAVRRLVKVKHWFPCANTIKFDTNGRLIDGQHRLLAIIEADEPRLCDVLYDAPPELAVVIDTGRARTLAHMLKIAGYSNDGLLSVALNTMNWVLTRDTAKIGMDRAEQLMVAIPPTHLIEAIEWMRDAQRQKLSNARLVGGVLLALRMVDEDAWSLATAVVNGSAPGSAAQKLREEMLAGDGARGGEQHRRVMLGQVISVLSAHKEGRNLSRLYQRDELIKITIESVERWFKRASVEAAAN